MSTAVAALAFLLVACASNGQRVVSPDGSALGDGGSEVDGGLAADGSSTPPDGGVRLDGGSPDGGPHFPDAGCLGDGCDPEDGGTAACPTDMVLAGPACVDRYEAPNVAGALPLAMQTAYDGERWCGARGKRLCTETEWIRACQGTAGYLYPYGNTYVAHRCNDDKTWIAPNWNVLGTWPSDAGVAEATRLYQGDPSGSRTGCVSQEGAFDLTGNVAEWVVRTLPNANNYDHVLKGCYWSKCYGGTNPNCTFVNPAHPGGFRTYEAGFRCCKDPERTP